MSTPRPPSTTSPVIVWFRRDLRLHDNGAWSAACATRRPVIPVFIWAPDEEAPWAPGAASRWWLHHSLLALGADLKAAGTPLIIQRGSSRAALQALLAATGASTVFWNRLYEPVITARDRAIKQALRNTGCEVESFAGHLMHEPWAVLTQQERPYQVFTPFYRSCQTLGEPASPLAAARPTSGMPSLKSLAVDDLGLLPAIRWDDGLAETWTPGEAGARERLDAFVAEAVAHYGTQRDLPACHGTSRLSPYLHFGEVSPRQIWYAARRAHPGGAAEPYLRQLVWREFAHHLLYHFPHTDRDPLRENFRAFPWADDSSGLKRWQRGLTGYPIVDAGMRELWRIGWMHNRVRMIAASFLVKDLLIPWQEGAAWFWDTLVDADLANNSLGWQWVAGCGADAAPYFRIFNPMLQGEKFDAEGAYLRRWLPALAPLDNRWIHRPFEAPPALRAGLPSAYRTPMGDHALARDAALAAYSQLPKRRESA